MNLRKNIDYRGLYAELDKALAAGLSQMELYLELGRLVSGRSEKGAAVMAAEYITANYPERTGFSPRNLRRMRDFYQMYKDYPEVLEQAMKIGWTQNIVIMEAELETDARLWYMLAVQKFSWSKAELSKQIATSTYIEFGLGKNVELCYTENNQTVVEIPEDNKDCFHGMERQSIKSDCPRVNVKTYTNSGSNWGISSYGYIYGRVSDGTAVLSEQGQNNVAERLVPQLQAKDERIGLYIVYTNRFCISLRIQKSWNYP